MVAGRVHLRLGQGRGAVPGPHPSLLETSIPSIAPAACLGIFHWWARGPPAGRPGPLPSRPGHTCGCAGAACPQRTLTHSLWLSLHRAMTLRVQELALELAAPRPLSCACPFLAIQCPGSARTQSLTHGRYFFTGTVVLLLRSCTGQRGCSCSSSARACELDFAESF